MKTISIAVFLMCILIVLSVSQCTQKRNENDTSRVTAEKPQYGGYGSNEKWGEHIVTIAGCNDCHSPKIMTAHGPDIDSTRLLSGHPANLPAPSVNRQEMETKGLAVTGDLTSWVGPWGISYTANLTSDETGIGKWKEEQFIYAIREGKFRGLPDSRPLLPPMPWQMYRHMSDDELKAVFAYLKSTKPIKNAVPPPDPPLAGK